MLYEEDSIEESGEITIDEIKPLSFPILFDKAMDFVRISLTPISPLLVAYKKYFSKLYKHLISPLQYIV